MALVLFDRVKETSNTAGTGTIVLAGAATGYQSFAVVGNGNTTYYTIADQQGSNWEVGIGTYYSGNVSLARTTILASSNANAAVSFGSNTKDVFVTYPAEKSVNQDATGNVTVLQTFTANNHIATANISSNVAAGAFSLGTLSYSDTGIFASYANTANTYVQIIAQNLSNGTNASTDFVVVNDTGTAYADFGITSSKYTGSGALSAANVAYIYAGAADLVIGTATANAVHFVVNNSATDAFTINASGAWGANGSYGTANQVYTSQGSGLPPVWANVASGGSGLPATGNNSIGLFNVNITSNVTINAGINGLAVGPIAIANNNTVTVTSNQKLVVI